MARIFKRKAKGQKKEVEGRVEAGPIAEGPSRRVPPGGTAEAKVGAGTRKKVTKKEKGKQDVQKRYSPAPQLLSPDVHHNPEADLQNMELPEDHVSPSQQSNGIVAQPAAAPKRKLEAVLDSSVAEKQSEKQNKKPRQIARLKQVTAEQFEKKLWKNSYDPEEGACIYDHCETKPPPEPNDWLYNWGKKSEFMAGKTSCIYKYFVKRNEKYAICRLCYMEKPVFHPDAQKKQGFQATWGSFSKKDQVFKGSTKNCLKHLKTQHREQIPAEELDWKHSGKAENPLEALMPFTAEGAMQQYLPYQKSGVQWRTITRCLAAGFAEAGLPPTLIEHPGFEKILHLLQPRYIPPCRQTIERYMFAGDDSLYHCMMKALQKELQKAKYIAFTSDCWSTGNKGSIINLHAHWTETAFQTPRNCIVAAESLADAHTHDYLLHKLQEIIKNLQLPLKQYAITTDSGSNIAKAVDEDDLFYWYKCACHALEASVRGAITWALRLGKIKRSTVYDEVGEVSEEEEEPQRDKTKKEKEDNIKLDAQKNEDTRRHQDALQRMRILSKRLHQSGKDLGLFQRIQKSILERDGVNAFRVMDEAAIVQEALMTADQRKQRGPQIKNIPASSQTRWCNTYAQVKATCDVKEAIIQFSQQVSKKGVLPSYGMTEEHFPPLLEVERILKPIVSVLRKLEDPACTIAQVLPSILNLVKKLQQLTAGEGGEQKLSDGATGIVNKFLDKLVRNPDAFFNDYAFIDELATVCFTHPLFKKLVFMGPILDQVKELIKDDPTKPMEDLKLPQGVICSKFFTPRPDAYHNVLHNLSDWRLYMQDLIVAHVYDLWTETTTNKEAAKDTAQVKTLSQEEERKQLYENDMFEASDPEDEQPAPSQAPSQSQEYDPLRLRIEQEVKTYLAETRVAQYEAGQLTEKSPFDWRLFWSRNEHKYPYMAKFAAWISPTQCSSCSSERDFSAAGYVNCRYRRGQVVDTTAAMTMLKCNISTFLYADPQLSLSHTAYHATKKARKEQKAAQTAARNKKAVQNRDNIKTLTSKDVYGEAESQDDEEDPNSSQEEFVSAQPACTANEQRIADATVEVEKAPPTKMGELASTQAKKTSTLPIQATSKAVEKGKAPQATRGDDARKQEQENVRPAIQSSCKAVETPDEQMTNISRPWSSLQHQNPADIPPPAWWKHKAPPKSWTSACKIQVWVKDIIAGTGSYIGVYNPDAEVYAADGCVFLADYQFPHPAVQKIMWQHHCNQTFVPFTSYEADIFKGKTNMADQKLVKGTWPWPIAWCRLEPQDSQLTPPLQQ